MNPQNRQQLKRSLNRIAAILFLGIFIIIFIEFIQQYITIDVLIRLTLIELLSIGIWITSIKIKVFNKISIQILILIVMAINGFVDSKYFYQANVFIIVVAHNYKGNINIKMDVPRSESRIKPSNGIVVIYPDINGNV